jgi:gamma-glutamylcyclotransferase (GGCT)/AIG2-like uncharacterized protein YtfP
MSRHLFVYGTLMAPEIIQRVAGLAPASEPARLPGYQCFAITGEVFPAILRRDTGEVRGLLYRNLSAPVLATLDDYEGDWYSRETVWVETQEGQGMCMALTFVVKPEHRHRLASEDWNFEEFRRLHLSRYLYSL